MNPSPLPESQPHRPKTKMGAGAWGALLLLTIIFLGARYAVTHWRRAGSMTVIEAQSMDMSVMKPPEGAVPVEVATVSGGKVSPGVSYTGTVVAYNDAQIAARITGRIVALPVYPGDRVRPGQLLARLDSDELRAKEMGARFARAAADQDRLVARDEASAARASQTQAGAEATKSAAMETEAQAQITHARASVSEARLMVEAQRQGVAQAQSEAAASRQDKEMAQAALEDAQAGLTTAQDEVENARAMEQGTAARLPQAQADLEGYQADLQLARDKRTRSADLLKQGAISKEEFQVDDAAVSNAEAKLKATQSRIAEVQSEMGAANAKIRQAQSGVVSAAAKVKSATSGIARAAANIAAADQKIAQARAEVGATQIKVLHAHADSDMARARLEQARAGVQAAGAVAQGARANEGKALHQTGKAAAMAAQAGAQLSEAAIVRGYTEIRAQSEGVVSKRLAAPGSLVDPGTPILQISQLNLLRFQANVAQSDLDTIRVGTPVTIRATAGAKSLISRVSAIFPSADPQSRTGIVGAVAPNSGGFFRPGQYIIMSLAGPPQGGQLKVPTESLVAQGATGGGSEVLALSESASVWVVERAHSAAPTIYTCTMHPQIRRTEPGNCPICHMQLTPVEAGGDYRARLSPVKTGVSDGQFTAVESGLKSGDRVITRGYDDLKDGDAVYPTRFGADGPMDLQAAGRRRDEPKAGAEPSSAVPASAVPASTTGELRITVDSKGFTPATFYLKRGVSARLTFVRTTDATCATEVVWPDYKIRQKLPLNVPVTINVTPQKSGSTTFACGMAMFKGTVLVR